MASILRKIVKNEAMKSDPDAIYNWRTLFVACSACFGAMSFGWDSSTIGGVIEMQTFIDAYKLGDSDSEASASLKANIVSTLQAGCFVGALAAFPLTDAYGRRLTLIWASLFTMAGIAMQAAGSGHLEPLYVGRFVAGLGVGAGSVITPILVSETSPRGIRGLLTGMYQLFIVTGGMIAFWANYGSLMNLRGPAQYVVPLAIQALPAILLFGLMIVNKESPRYLARKDRWEEAKEVLTVLRGLGPDHEYVKDELQEIQEQLNYERQLMGDATFWTLQKEMWLVPANRKRAALSVALMICQQMTGTNAINTYAPTIFKNLGVGGTTSSLLSTGVYGIVKVTSCTIFLIFMADSLGRRRSLLVSSVGQTFCMFYIGLYVRISPPVDGAPVPGAGYFALVCIFVFAAFFQFGWGPACWILVSEIPTARLRSMNVAIGAATQWLFNFVVAISVPVMLTTVGAHGYGTYLIFGSFCFAMFFFVWFLIPETKGVSLEHMDELFGVAHEDKRMLAHADQKTAATEDVAEHAERRDV